MNDSVFVRPGSLADGSGMAEVFLAARAEVTYLPDLHPDEQTRIWMSRVMVPEHEVWVAAAHDTVVGFAALSNDWLEHLYVAPLEVGDTDRPIEDHFAASVTSPWSPGPRTRPVSANDL